MTWVEINEIIKSGLVFEESGDRCNVLINTIAIAKKLEGEFKKYVKYLQDKA